MNIGASPEMLEEVETAQGQIEAAGDRRHELPRLADVAASCAARVAVNGALSHVAMMRAHSGLVLSRLHMAKQLVKLPEGSLDLLDDIERIDRFLTSIHSRVEALAMGKEIP